MRGEASSLGNRSGRAPGRAFAGVALPWHYDPPMVRPGCALLPFLGVLAVVFAASGAPRAGADDAAFRGEHASAELVAETTSVRPGSSVTLGVVFRVAPHWHVYWKNVGDVGSPPTAAWKLPEGVTAGPLQWPAPSRYVFGDNGVFIYEGEVMLPVEVAVPATFAGASITLTADVDWLVCRDEECVPDAATLSLTLPVGAAPPAVDPARRELFAATRARLPSALPAGKVGATRESDALFTLRLRGDGPWTDPAASVEFFPEADLLVNKAAPRVVRGDGQTALLLPRAKRLTEPPVSLRGTVVVTRGGAHAAFDVDAPIGAAGREPWLQPTDLSLALALLLAFLGGIVLNLMPCVLPVLSLKVLGFVERADEAPALVRRHGFVYGAGVLASFGALAAVLLVLRAGGEGVGWGFQLQDPRFVAMLCLVMAALGASLFGAIDLGAGLARLGGSAAVAKGYTASFLGGALATVVATPCTGPFMGPALGFALTRPAVEAVAIMLSLGVGMALPYVLLAAFPRWLRWVPRPGAWMDTLKTAMAFPLIATAIWLAWVLGQQNGVDGMLLVLGAALVLCLGLWLFGHYGAPHRSTAVRWLAGVGLGVGLVVVAVLVGLRAARPPPAPLAWEAWSTERVAEATASGKTVLVDFTADWCLTCKVNESTVLASDEVRAAVERRGVVLLKADWTRRDARIAEALARFGRASVPLYVVHSPVAGREPVVLETNPLLTVGEVTRAFEAAAPAPASPGR